MDAYKKMTTPESPVGAGAEQSSSVDNTIISENAQDCKMPDESFLKMQLDILQMIDPSFLATISMQELYERIFQRKPPIIEGLLYTGTYLFVGAPKLGKSFFMAQLAYHVSTGTPLWEYPVRRGTVLYLALEDDYRRLQERLYRMFGTAESDRLYFSIKANQIGKGLDEQLAGFIGKHKDTSLIIIDTLQKIREIGSDAYSYASDYEVITKLKHFADQYHICLMLVHHTRKQQSDDKFDMISGTNGLLGAADGAFLLHKEKRTSASAILEISGRDQQDQRLYLTRNPEKLSWDLEKKENDLWKEPPEPLLEAIAKLVTPEHPEWSGTATELVAALGLEMKPNTLTLKLNVNAGRLSAAYNIQYSTARTHDSKLILLKLSI